MLIPKTTSFWVNILPHSSLRSCFLSSIVAQGWEWGGLPPGVLARASPGCKPPRMWWLWTRPSHLSAESTNKQGYCKEFVLPKKKKVKPQRNECHVTASQGHYSNLTSFSNWRLAQRLITLQIIGGAHSLDLMLWLKSLSHRSTGLNADVSIQMNHKRIWISLRVTLSLFLFF